MMTWSHGKFREILAKKAEEYPWVRVIEVPEDYTSKTCGRCGRIHWRLGGNKEFNCPHCGYETDRDGNGSRNILMYWLGGASPTISSIPAETTGIRAPASRTRKQSGEEGTTEQERGKGRKRKRVDSQEQSTRKKPVRGLASAVCTALSHPSNGTVSSERGDGEEKGRVLEANTQNN